MPEVIHWGEWLLERARFVGFRRQKDLAAEVGCRVEQLSRWVAMSEPPVMRKGFDERLAKALRTKFAVLFREYRSVPASIAPMVGADPADADADILRRKIVAVAELLPVEKLRHFFSQGETLLHSNVA